MLRCPKSRTRQNMKLRVKCSSSLEKLDCLFHSMEVLFPGYSQNISRIFPYHGLHLHTMELDKTMKIGFSNLFLQYFQNTSIRWKRSNFSSASAKCHVTTEAFEGNFYSTFMKMSLTLSKFWVRGGRRATLWELTPSRLFDQNENNF